MLRRRAGKVVALLLRFCAFLALMAIGLGLLGCGSSSSGSARDRYIAKLDTVCARFAKQLGPDRRAFRKALGERHDLDTVAASLHRTARDLAREYNRLNDYAPPAPDALKLGRMLHSLEAEALISDEYAIALEAPGPRATGVFAEEIQTDAKEARRIAQEYGFKVCGASG